MRDFGAFWPVFEENPKSRMAGLESLCRLTLLPPDMLIPASSARSPSGTEQAPGRERKRLTMQTGIRDGTGPILNTHRARLKKMMNDEQNVEGRCADCVLNLLQISSRGPGRYGYCRLRRVPLEYPWAMVCRHYQYWGDRPAPNKPRLLLERAVFPLLDYASQKPAQGGASREDLKARHAGDMDDDVKRNVGAMETAEEFLNSPLRRQAGLLCGYLSGYNPYNFVIAINALHHFPLEQLEKDRDREILEKALDPNRKADFSGDSGLVADKISSAVAWALARLGRDLPEYLDSLGIEMYDKDYEKRILAEALDFVRNPERQPRGFLYRLGSRMFRRLKKSRG